MTTTHITRNVDLFEFANGVGKATSAANRFLSNSDSPAAIRLIAAVKAAYDRGQVRLVKATSVEEAVVIAPVEIVEPVVEPVRPIWPGTYTIEHDGGHTTFKVIIQASDADFAPGKMIIGYLTGRDNTGDYTSFGFVNPGNRLSVWKRFQGHTDLLTTAATLLADPFAESVVWAKHCARCGDLLSVPLSVERGYGPTCYGKGLK